MLPCMELTVLIHNRAVKLMGLINYEAVNLIDLEHSIQFFLKGKLYGYVCVQMC